MTQSDEGDDIAPPEDNEINDLNYLMNKPVAEMSSKDIDGIILYHRNQRALKEAGKGRIRGPTAPTPDAIRALLQNKPKGISRRGF